MVFGKMEMIDLILLGFMAILSGVSGADLTVSLTDGAGIDQAGKKVTRSHTDNKGDYALTCAGIGTDSGGATITADTWNWYKDGRALTPVPNIYTIAGPKLTIQEFIAKDAGRYSCEASQDTNKGTGHVDIAYTCRPSNLADDCGTHNTQCTGTPKTCSCTTPGFIFQNDNYGCRECISCGGATYGTCINQTWCVCKTGYINEPDGLCGPCTEAAESCGPATAGSCSATTKKCECKLGVPYDGSNGKCKECGGADDCGGSTYATCTNKKCVCKAGFIFGSNGQCEGCAGDEDCGGSTAGICTIATKCTCKSGYEFGTDGKCTAKPTTSSASTEKRNTGTDTSSTRTTSGCQALSSSVLALLIAATATLCLIA